MARILNPGLWGSRAYAFFGMSARIMAVVFLGRIMIDIGTRMFFPFIPQFAAGLGLTVVGFGWLLFARSIMGMAGPVFGLLADRYGRRKIMAIGLLSQVVGLGGIMVLEQWWATLPIALSGLSLAVFIPAQQAYIGDQAQFRRRGRALASMEFAWAASAIVALPVAGWMIDAYGWRSPFLAISLLSLAAAGLVWRQLPPVEPGQQRGQAGLSLAEARAICLRPHVLATIAASFLLFLAATCSATIWSIWLTADFGLTAAALGMIATTLGGAELGGSVISSLFIDRIGRRRGSGVGLLATALLFGLLPLTRSSLLLIIPGLIGLALVFEFTIVSMVSVYAEQAPEARGTVFSLALLGTAAGAAVAAPLTALLWERFGLEAVCLVGAVALVGAFGLLWRLLR